MYVQDKQGLLYHIWTKELDTSSNEQDQKPEPGTANAV